MHSYLCPSCSSPLSVAETPHIGDLVICPVCHKTYEVVWLFPLELSPIINQPEVKSDNLPE
jgi:lysine biosynthesis protein LysW